MCRRKAKSKSIRKAKVDRNGQINDCLEEEVENTRKPFTGHIGTVNNVSDEEILESVAALFAFGLQFCPIPSEVDIYKLKKDLWEAERR